jgi:hypothetical protein
VVSLVVCPLVVAVAVLDDGEQAPDPRVGAELLGELTDECGLDVFPRLGVATRQEPPRCPEHASEQEPAPSLDDGPGDRLRVGRDPVNLTGACGGGLLS